MAKRNHVRELELQANQLGFEFAGYTGSGHIRFRHVEFLVTYIASASPSCRHTGINALKEMERLSGVKLPRRGQGHHRRKSSLN